MGPLGGEGLSLRKFSDLQDQSNNIAFKEHNFTATIKNSITGII